MNKVLVTGATGNVRRPTVAALRKRGAAVRAFVRDESKARRLLGADVELVVGDFDDPASLRRAMQGVDTVFLTSADGPDKVDHENAVIDMASVAWVRRVVKLSSPRVEIGSDLVFWDWHGRIEQHLRASGVPAVCLRAGFLMTNLLAAAEAVAATGQLFAPAGDAKIAMTDPVDVGTVAAVLLTEDGHDGEVHVLTGPAAPTYHDVAAEISAATGRTVEFVDIPDAAARAALSGSGAPDWLVSGVVTMFGKFRAGAGAEVTDTVPRLTGRPARSLADWIRDHTSYFVPVGQPA